jgi:hypothetical protein
MYYSPSTATCDYRILTGQGRGDKGGNECTKYATGERPRLPWELVYGKEWEDE